MNRNQHLTFKANAGAGRHGWLRLTPAYGVRLVRDRISHLPEGSVVTDPFSGTGTTALAAAELGHLGQSLDVNPFLVWLGRVKTAHYSLEVCEGAVTEGKVLAEAAARDVSERSDLWEPSLFRIERWWSSGVLRELKALRFCIDECDADDQLRDLLGVALCRTLIARSNAAFNHQSMSFRNVPSERLSSEPGEVLDTIAQFEREAAELAASAEHDLPGDARVLRGDSRRMLDDLEPCDLLLTSPPYVNRMSYIRELRPYMYWLRFLDAAADAGDLDWHAIGGTWGTATSRLNGWKPTAATPMDGVVQEVGERIATDGGRNGPLLATYVHKYFHDMWLHFQVAAGHVKPGGKVCYIIGNSSFYGHVVPAEQWYAALLEQAGFERVRVEMIRKRNSNKALFEYEVSAIRP